MGYEPFVQLHVALFDIGHVLLQQREDVVVQFLLLRIFSNCFANLNHGLPRDPFNREGSEPIEGELVLPHFAPHFDFAQHARRAQLRELLHLLLVFRQRRKIVDDAFQFRAGVFETFGLCIKAN